MKADYRAILNDALGLPKEKEMQARDIYHHNENLWRPKKSATFLPSAFPKLNGMILLSGAKITHEQGKTPVTMDMGDNANIRMPMPEDFISPDAYGHVLLHELAHWTNHKGIIHREFAFAGFGSSAQEELTAELSSYMLGDMFGITGMDQMALSYLKHFTEMLQNNWDVIADLITADALFEESFNEAQKVVAWVRKLVGE